MSVSWVADPSVLLDFGASDPMRGTVVERSNAVARLVILASVIAFIVSRCASALLMGAGALGLLAMLETRGGIEGLVGDSVDADNAMPGLAGAPKPLTFGVASFQGMQSTNDVERAGLDLSAPAPHVPSPPRGAAEVELQTPTASNPLMNVLLTDYVTDPARAPAAPAFSPEIEEVIAEQPAARLPPSVAPGGAEGDSRLFRDLGDELDSEYMMRQFYATANTQIPNAQGAFAEWIGRPWPGASDTFGRQPAESTYAQTSWAASTASAPATAAPATAKVPVVAPSAAN
jgi:hypothetical protein